MPRLTGNDLWWAQVESKQQELGTHYHDAELELFTVAVRKMAMDGMTMTMIREHFHEVFGIGMSAFYARLKKMGTRWVLPISMRKEPS